MAGEDRELVAAVLDDVENPERRLWELARFDTAIEGFPHPVFLSDASGYVTFSNPAFGDQLGYQDTEDLHVSDFIGDDDVDLLLDWLRDHVAAERMEPASRTVELTAATIDGRSLVFEGSFTLLPAGETEFTGVGGMLRDVTIEKRRAEVFDVMDRTLRHNLRNSVTVINGTMGVLENELDDDYSEMLEKVYESATDLQELGNRLRTIRNAIDESFERDASMHVEELVEMSISTATRGQQDVAVETNYSARGELDAPIPAQHALANVIENAIVHNDSADPTVDIWVTHAPTKGWIDIHVEDNGPGIPEFERKIVLGEGSADQLEHGSGLGLWIARWVVEVFGGKLEIEDKEPTGTVVSLRLPLADTAPTST